jgi:large repetitive protein
MAELQKVSWRTAGYALLGSAVAIASVVAIVRSDGIHPTSLTSNAATRWLVYQPEQLVVLADGLSGRVLAKIDAESDASGEVAVQGAGGAFLVAPSQGSVRTISTARLQLGTAQPVASLSQVGINAAFGVGASGLTVINSETDEANVVAVDDITRPIEVPDSTSSLVATDGSMWLFTDSQATHVNVDESSQTMALRGRLDPSDTTTVGPHAVSFDRAARIVHWLDGGDVPVDSIANSFDAVLQERGDDAPCVWLGAGDTLSCVGKTGIDNTIPVDGMNLQIGDRLAVTGSVAVVVRANNQVDRLDLAAAELSDEPGPTAPQGARLTITATNDMIWIDDQIGIDAWVVHRFGVNHIDKDDGDVPVRDTQGQVKTGGSGGDDLLGTGNEPGSELGANQLDRNGLDDPPNAIDDSVTARSGNSVIIPVTGNDWDPDGDAIAVFAVQPTGHAATDVVNGTSVAYFPDPGFSGTDTFQYTIVDEHGNAASANVTVQLLAPGSPNQPPIAGDDRVTTRPGNPIIIDVLANDIDPERDVLSVPTFQQNGSASVTNAIGPTLLPALRYEPPAGNEGVGINTFTYQAADPHGGTSEKATVTVEVIGKNVLNKPPETHPDAIRLPVGVTARLDVLANDIDPDNDELTIDVPVPTTGVKADVRGKQLVITLQPGAEERSVVVYRVHDGTPSHDRDGRVLVLRISDTAQNRPPVANPDAERVVIGYSVMIPVTANDIDPDSDIVRLQRVDQPANGVGTTSVEGNSVRFTPNLPDITQPTQVSFTYQISDGKGHDATGNVSVTVLAEALPHAPFARDDPADTVQDKPVTIDVLANDSDPSGGRPSLIAVSCPAGGTADRTADDRVTFTPPPLATGTFRCRYEVTNTQGLTASASIIVVVTDALPGNHAPVLDTTEFSMYQGETLTLRADQIATDEDGDRLVFVEVDQPIAGNISFVANSSSVTYSAPAADSTLVPVVQLDTVISDQMGGGNVPALISIKIDKPIPKAPPRVAPIPSGALVGDTVRIDVLAALRDLNSGAVLSLKSAQLESGPAAPPEVNGGVVSFVPTAEGTVIITYTVVNSDLLEASETITVTVTAPPVVNPPPVAGDDDLSVASGGVNSVDLLANDSGISDQGDKVSVSLVNPPPTTFGVAVLSNGVLTFTAAPDAAGTVLIQYTLNDGNSSATPGTITVTILTCADSPPSAPEASIFTPYQTPINIDLTQHVASGSIRPGSITGAGLTGPTGTYTPPAGMSDAETVTFTVENGCNQAAQGTLTIDVNRVPVGGNIARSLAAGSTLTMVISELASDDEPLQINSINDPVPPWVSLAGTTITASPVANASGTYTFTATVADPGGLTAIVTINLTVSNQPPSALPDVYTLVPPVPVPPPTPFSFDPTSNDFDPEGGPLCVQAVAVIDGATTIVAPPPICYTQIDVSLGHGVTNLSYTIRDAGGLTSLLSSTITITSNNPPSVADVTASTVGQPTPFDVLLPAADQDGDSLVATCTPPPGVDVVVTPAVLLAPFLPGFNLSITVPIGFLGATMPCSVSDTFTATPVSVTLTII